MALKRRKMFVSILPGEQIEVVLTRDGTVQEYYVEMLQQSKTKRNIYKGTIHNIDPALQAAFVDYGAQKNGFLQIDEVHPEYYVADVSPKKGQRFPPLQQVLKPGQEVLVQIVKEPTGSKGAFLSTYLTLPGRYIVLTPGRGQLAVSRKIEEEKERARLKSIMEEMSFEEGVGAILRTVSEGQNKTNLSRDLQFLHRLWKEVRRKGQTEKPPVLLYEEKDLAFRAVRDYLTQDVKEVWVDHEETARQIKDYAALIFPRRKRLVKVHRDTEKMLFDRFGITSQLETVHQRNVSLPSGGEVVMDQTEAMTAVDINSGKISGEKNFQEMALRTNLEAAHEIAQQLRLRDIGGQVVIDFIEMKDSRHCREVEKAMRAALKEDKARTTVGRISQFGLMEMVRQRMGSSALSTVLQDCPRCRGAGKVKNREWHALQVLKDIYQSLLAKDCPAQLDYTLDRDTALYILNTKRDTVQNMENRFGTKIQINAE
ncbi:MAG: Rne/Rng family ribonuclease [Desulfohalobiaceae bacterium]